MSQNGISGLNWGRAVDNQIKPCVPFLVPRITILAAVGHERVKFVVSDLPCAVVVVGDCHLRLAVGLSSFGRAVCDIVRGVA